MCPVERLLERSQIRIAWIVLHSISNQLPGAFNVLT
jgi:hypothetical protein